MGTFFEKVIVELSLEKSRISPVGKHGGYVTFQGKMIELECLKMFKGPVWQEQGMKEEAALFHSPTHDPKGADAIVTLFKENSYRR